MVSNKFCAEGVHLKEEQGMKGWGRAARSTAEQGRALRQDRALRQGRALRQSRAARSRAGLGTASRQGRAGQGRAGQGRAGQGEARQG